MIIKTTPGKTYVVESDNGCTVKRLEASTAALTVEAGAQGYFVATAQEYEVSDDSARVVQVFNSAPMAASGGGGVSVTVDQAFSATSENAQSGVAVAKAFSAHYYVKNAGSAVCIGNGSSVAGPGREALAIGHSAWTANWVAPLAIGATANCDGDCGVSLGFNATSKGAYAAAIGSRTKNKDKFTTVIGCFNNTDNLLTQLYLMCAGSPLANTYEGGEACLGYVVKDLSGNISACGTRKLSELFTNNTAFAPAALGLDDEPAPGPFLPTGIMEPIELDEFSNN
jgi:hypothetical protein